MIASNTMPIIAEIVTVIELIGAAIIIAGAAWSLAKFLLSLAAGHVSAIERFRTQLGRAIILGLEFLVAADIINTVVIDMSLNNVASLAAIVAIRIVLSFALEAEIEGRWPWERASDKRA